MSINHHIIFSQCRIIGNYWSIIFEPWPGLIWQKIVPLANVEIDLVSCTMTPAIMPENDTSTHLRTVEREQNKGDENFKIWRSYGELKRYGEVVSDGLRVQSKLIMSNF